MACYTQKAFIRLSTLKRSSSTLLENYFDYRIWAACLFFHGFASGILITCWIQDFLIFKSDESVLHCPKPSNSAGHTLFDYVFVINIMWVLPAWNNTKGAWKSTECSGQRTTFLLLWHTAFRILPFKVRPHSVSPYPMQAWSCCLPLGPLGSPDSPFISCHQPVKRSHLQEISKQLPFLRP